jgi:hypothetical protein
MDHTSVALLLLCACRNATNSILDEALAPVDDAMPRCATAAAAAATAASR